MISYTNVKEDELLVECKLLKKEESMFKRDVTRMKPVTIYVRVAPLVVKFTILQHFATFAFW